jgi:DNA repair protein SbcC/Rad50
LSKYVIKKLYIKNFKSIDQATLELGGSNLNVLDGPNGFGKTTIYDAIQLILTGKIRRIESNKIVTSNRGFNDHLLSKDQTQPTIIKIEFENSSQPKDRFVLARILTPTALTNIQRRPGDFSHFHLYKLNNIEEEDFQERITDRQLNNLFGVESMEDRYNLFHYIEQEESCYLFKQNEKDRMSAISKLFNIEKEMNQKQFLDKVKKKLINERTKLEVQIRDLENELNQDKQTNSEIQPYNPLIETDNVLNVPWDKENIKPLDTKIKEEYYKELDEINHLILNFKDFKNQLKNEELNKIQQNDNKLKAIIILGHFYNEFNELEKRYKDQLKLEQYNAILKNKEIIQKAIDWDFLLEILELPIEKEIIIQRINLIKSYNQNSNAISTVVNQMNQTREKLWEDYQKYIESNPNNKNHCPLCGDSKDSFEDLLNQINHQTQELKENFDTATKKVNDELENLYTEYLNVITNQIEKRVSVLSLNKEFFEQLKSYNDQITDMTKAKDWFKELGINIDLYTNKEMKLVVNLDETVLTLLSEIENKKSIVSDFCKEHMNSFRALYRNRFNQNDELVAKIDTASIVEKKNYIENQYFLQSSLVFQKVQQLKGQQEKLEETIQALGRIITIYNDKINKHRGRMISDIEIPFYVYSGKIIQNHQRGIGVFIKEDKVTNQAGETQLKSINFVPPQKTDHDIVHSFSSGQLSSTVIAFTLALNKVYGNKGLMTLLIDDPIQTMDEMNMASFVELLRNEFTDRQLILSTHEDNISLFIRYKFLKYGLSVGKINVKQRLYAN